MHLSPCVPPQFCNLPLRQGPTMGRASELALFLSLRICCAIAGSIIWSWWMATEQRMVLGKTELVESWDHIQE